MKCSLLTLSCALDGELSRERQLELDAHLITCERCKTGMRYLREETERISLLAPVRLSGGTASALLERSRVVVSAGMSSALTGGEEADDEAGESILAAPDPFGALGIGPAILEEPATAELPTTAAAEEIAEDSAPELEQGSAYGALEADRSDLDALAAVPEELWLAEAPEEVTPEIVAPDQAPTDVAWASSAALEEIQASAPGPEPESPSQDPAEAEPVFGDLEDTTSTNRPSSIVVPGWEPATEIKVPWRDIPPATPTADTWTPDLTTLPLSRDASPPPPATQFAASAPPARPAAAAIPGLQADREPVVVDREIPRRTGGGGSRRPIAPKSGGDGPEARSWTRTGLIAVAALAVVLILWNVTHGSGKTPVSHHARGQATPLSSAKPSPSPSTGPTATPTPFALTGTQTVGSTGSGYQLQTVRYGVHGSQYWVVFQMVQGSGSPQITCGFDGPETLYVEMKGVAPGTSVAQPPPGAVVSSISIGHVSGFTGAVYILHLTKPMQVSPSLLPGTESGGAGERYLDILQ
ncbi:MAG: zf-HC2 domain-containing protein [Candidatus Dormiibacterota bacterium]